MFFVVFFDPHIVNRIFISKDERSQIGTVTPMGNLESPAHLDLVSSGSLDRREFEHDLQLNVFQRFIMF